MAPKLGFEAAGGMIEKFLPGVSFPVLMNAVLPGALAAAALLPFTGLRPASLSLDVEKIWPELAIAALVVVALGGLISSLNGEVYKIYEGRTFWPRWLSDKVIAQQQRRVERLHSKAEKEANRERYNEIWYRLRIYPFDPATGRRQATHPTLLGNILAGYEEYPKNCYGIDSVFYWPRLWLIVDKDSKEEIGKSWAVADGLLSLSAVSLIAGLVWACAIAGACACLWSGRHLPVHDHFAWSCLATGGWFLLFYGFYRVSLPFHRQNGEIFKSLFDLYRDKLIKITALTPREPELWTAAWAYLQYLKIRCPKCGSGYYSVFTKKCGTPECDANIEEVLNEFRQTGKLVKQPKDGVDAKESCRVLLSELLKALDDNPESKPKA